MAGRVRPASDLVDERPDIGAIWSRVDVDRAIDALANADDAGVAMEVLAAARWQDDPGAGVIDAVAALAAAGEPSGVIADRVGLSVRQLHRRSLDAFGYGTKTLVRILRMQRAVALTRSGTAPASAAAAAGYADQAHLSRDVRALAGIPLGELLR